MRTFSLSAGLLLASCLAVFFLDRPHAVEAGTAIRMDIGELAETADLILEARVLSAHSFEVDGTIETEYLLRVDRTLAGDDEPYRSVRMPGGVLPDGRGMILAGMPRIVPGEDELLFLSQAGATGMRVPVGLAQGKLTIVEHADGSRSLMSEMGGVVLVSEDGSLVQGEGSSSLEYAEVIAQIEAGLAAKSAKGSH